jgi:hypothetical protein
MKNVLIIILLYVCLISCFNVEEYERPIYNIDLPSSLKNDISDCLGIGNFYKAYDIIGDFVITNILYFADYRQFGQIEYWQSPDEVIINKKGDCEDRTILWMWLVYQYCGVKPIAIHVWNKWNYSISHLFGYIDGYRFYYNPDNYNSSNTYDFWTAMKMAEYIKDPF